MIITGSLAGAATADSTTILALFARFAAMGASCATWVITPELFTTDIRVTAHALMAVVSKMGAFASPYIVDSQISVTGVAMIIGLSNLVAAGAAFMLPETAGKNIDDPEEEEEGDEDLGVYSTRANPKSSLLDYDASKGQA